MRSLLRKLIPAPAPIRDGTPMPHIHPDLQRRVRMTVSCTDCDALPKVRGAGECFSENGVKLQRMFNGIKVVEDGYCGPWLTEIVRRLRGHHEPQEEFAFHTVLPHIAPGGTIVELGCWWSFYALWFLQSVRDGRAVLVEPDSIHLALGQQNFALNNCKGEFVHATIGKTKLPPRPFASESPNAVPLVPEVSLDSIVAEKNLKSVDVLLADVQGAELNTLEGAIETIRAGKLRFVFVSTHHHSISGDPLLHAKCAEFIRQHGGHILADHTVMESYSGDGLIVASFHPADRGLPPIPISHNTAAGSIIFYPPEHDLAEAYESLNLAAAALQELAVKHPDAAAKWQQLQQRSAYLMSKCPAGSLSKAA